MFHYMFTCVRAPGIHVIIKSHHHHHFGSNSSSVSNVVLYVYLAMPGNARLVLVLGNFLGNARLVLVDESRSILGPKAIASPPPLYKSYVH